MDDSRFWMWEKQQRAVQGLTMRGSANILNTDAQATPHSSYDVSWEERAFAEDAAGPLGGCIWPPRSYSCNFCGREFRSAQALGGHMNVHRRDRARLKQSSSSLSPQDVFDHHQPSQQLQLGSQSQKPFVASHVVASKVCDLAYNPSPSTNPNPVSFNMTAPTSLYLKMSSPSATEHVKLDQEPKLGVRGQRAWSKNTTANDQNSHTSDLKMDADKRGSQIPKYLGEGGLIMNCDKPDISVSLNLFLFQTQARTQSKNKSAGDDDQDDVGTAVNSNAAGSKRRKLTADDEPSINMSSSYKNSSITVDRLDVQQLIIPAQQISSSFTQELDLELRLGEQPKVKIN